LEPVTNKVSHPEKLSIEAAFRTKRALCVWHGPVTNSPQFGYPQRRHRCQQTFNARWGEHVAVTGLYKDFITVNLLKTHARKIRFLNLKFKSGTNPAAQHNSPATPENSAVFWREKFQTVCFNLFILKRALKLDAQRLLKNFLTRNELVASAFV
jgi:hypothetical protein